MFLKIWFQEKKIVTHLFCVTNIHKERNWVDSIGRLKDSVILTGIGFDAAVCPQHARNIDGVRC